MTTAAGRRAAAACRILPAAVALAAAALAMTGCASTPDPTPTPTGTADALTGSITVFAAASLTQTFEQLADAFEAEHPGTRITFSFAGSSDLVAQLIEGAPGDVFASANEANMTKLVDAGLADGEPTVFATNVLEIAVPPGNPGGVTDFASLADPGLRLVVCAEAVPCGAATVVVEAATGVVLAPVSEENAVTDVLGKVASGEADAGLVYATDVLGADGAVEGIPFPESAEAVNRYPIVRVAGAANAELADAFIAYVLGAEGAASLAAAGFGTP